MRALTAAVIAALVLVPLSGASARISYTFKTRQGPTAVHPHPPNGGVGDTYDSSLVLRNAGIAQLGAGRHGRVGSMQLEYTIRRQCAAFTPTCVATADFRTETTFPDGSVRAGGKGISIAAANIRIPVTGGTERYRGARGWVTISPTSTRISTFALTLP